MKLFVFVGATRRASGATLGFGGAEPESWKASLLSLAIAARQGADEQNRTQALPLLWSVILVKSVDLLRSRHGYTAFHHHPIDNSDSRPYVAIPLTLCASNLVASLPVIKSILIICMFQYVFA